MVSKAEKKRMSKLDSQISKIDSYLIIWRGVRWLSKEKETRDKEARRKVLDAKRKELRGKMKGWGTPSAMKPSSG